MMSKIKVVLFSLLFAPLLSHATLFDFSYTFQQGYGDDRGPGPTLVKGSFTGVQEGQFVKNIENIKVNIQGRDFSQPLVSVLYDPLTGNPWDYSQEGQVSFDATLNNFLFTDLANTNYFYFAHYEQQLLRQASNDNGGQSYGFDDDSSRNDSWQLSVSEVPEPGALLLLSLGLLVLVPKRYFGKSKPA